jgi:hypothetical protein
MSLDIQKILKDLVDHLMPDLTPHETSMYVFLLRHSYLNDEAPSSTVRMGQRTIAQLYGRGPKKSVPSRQHVLRQLESLAEKGCIRIGDTSRDGTLYDILLPSSVPLVIEKLSVSAASETDDYYNDSEKRKEIYERDQWICQYCGDRVALENTTLDHFVPQCKGGTNKKENLRTACLLCNSVKSGKSYEEAAVYLLKSIQTRRGRDAQKDS